VTIAATRWKQLRTIVGGVAASSIVALVGLHVSAADAALYDQVSGPDVRTTVPSSVTVERGKSNYTLDTSSLFEKRYDVGYPRSYVSIIDGRTRDWANLAVGKHTVTQQFEYDKYASTSANCYVSSWYDGYDDVDGSYYTIKCETPWGPVEADAYFDWYENPFVMTLYGMGGEQFPVTSYPGDQYGDWYIFAPASVALDRGKTFAGRLVSHDNPQAKSMKLTTSVTVLGRIATTRPKISDTTPKVGQKIKISAIRWRAGSHKPTLTYQWYANGRKIKGATKATFTVKGAQRAKAIKVKVTGASPGYTKTSVASKSTQKVK